MAKRSGRSTHQKQLPDGLVPIIVLTACFLCAGLAGCLSAAASGEHSIASLSSYLYGYLTLLADGEAAVPSIWAIFWEICCWPLLALLLGMTALGALAIPAVFCVRGFLLSYAVSAFVRVFGQSGLLAAAAVFGMTVIASVPVLFSVGSTAFSASLDLAGGLGGSIPGTYLKRYLVQLPACGGLVLFSVLIQRSVMPQLMCAAAAMLLER